MFPPSFLPHSEVLSELRGHAEHRILKHRKGFYFWMLIAPMTAPFIIIRASTWSVFMHNLAKQDFFIAIIPNLPFFFCAWRSWSHYRGIFFWDHLVSLVSYAYSVVAYRSSQYIQSLLDHDIIVPEASEPLDGVFKSHPATTPSASRDEPDSTSKPTSSSSESSIPKTNPDHDREPQHTLLLSPEAIPLILSLFELESTTSVDLHRAIEQARLRVASGRVDL